MFEEERMDDAEVSRLWWWLRATGLELLPFPTQSQSGVL